MGSCNSLLATARAIASTRARSRGEADSQRPSFSARTCSTSALPRSRSALTVGSASSWPSQRAKRWISSSTICSARAASSARVDRLRETTACRSSMSYRLTPRSSAHAGSMSRGTAMSISSSERPARSRITSSSSARPTIGWGEDVDDSTMSARASSSGRHSSPTTRPPKRCARPSARSAWRLATNTVPAPRSASALAVSSLISPAPRITTCRPPSSPSTLRARSTATEGTLIPPAPSEVSERTRLPVVSAAANSRFVNGPAASVRAAASCARRTCPWISASPRIIESSPAVTR